MLKAFINQKVNLVNLTRSYFEYSNILHIQLTGNGTKKMY